MTVVIIVCFQIPYLADGVRIHGEKVSEALRPFHDRLEACFKQLREKVEKQYGVKTLPAVDDRRGTRPRSMLRSFTMPSQQRPLSVASVNSISSDNSPSRPGSDGFALEPLLPKKLHCKSQDKLERDESERERKDKKKEKRNSKHQEIFDKELKTTDISLQPARQSYYQPTEASETKESGVEPVEWRPPSLRVPLTPSPIPPGPPPITPRNKLSFSLLTVSRSSLSSLGSRSSVFPGLSRVFFVFPGLSSVVSVFLGSLGSSLSYLGSLGSSLSSLGSRGLSVFPVL
uniref:dedicator of cytokinesis protein 1-like n=1 Tax=Oncorhynchus gorbuscha TaxID=8017 RepID=UPI001EAECBB1|nr:dedicator of cytokinesis protein 1-like [Oncorhynchus gorbuscha]